MNINEHNKPHPLVDEKAEEVARYVRQIQSGDRSAFDLLYDSTEQYIYFCISGQGVPEGDVADVMQEVYLAVYKDLHTIKKPIAAMGWMKSIAFHKSMDYFRRRGKDVLTEEKTEEVLEVQEEGTLRLPEDVMEKEEIGRLVRDLINELPKKYRQVLLMYYFLECSVAEIAKETGIQEGTVKTMLYRARKELGVSIETLEKQQGIRLHSVLLVPVLGLLFHKDAQAAQIPAEVHAKVTETLAHVIGTTAGNSAGVAVGNTVGATAGNAAGAAAGFAVKKLIITIITTLCIGVGAAMLIWQGNKDTNQETVPLQSTVTLQHTEVLIDKTELFDAYKKLYENIMADRTWPDKSSLGISKDLGEALQYAVQDLDGDGNEEMVVSVVTADYMAAYMERVYKYDPLSKECVQVASTETLPEYYDNGIIYEPAANPMRFISGILSFNKESGVYEEIAGTQLIERYGMEVIGLTFPEEADKDGDDLVWKICEGDKETYMDNKEGEEWIQDKIGTGKPIKVNYILFSEGWKY